MKQEIATLQEDNKALVGQIDSLTGDKESIQSGLDAVQQENSLLKEKIDQLNDAVETLQNSEEKIKALIADLSARLENAESDQAIKDQLSKLESLQGDTQNELKRLADRIRELEAAPQQTDTAPEQTAEAADTVKEEGHTSAGIFSYFDNDTDKKVFIEKVEEAVSQEMTYAQIDDFLTKNLSKELDKIVKDHPTLTKTYIRGIREQKAD